MFSRRRILFFTPSILIVVMGIVWMLRALFAEPAQDDRVMPKDGQGLAAPTQKKAMSGEAPPRQAMLQEPPDRDAASVPPAMPGAPESSVAQRSLSGRNDVVHISVFPPEPVTEPANMAEAEERMYPSAPAPGSLGAAVRAYEQSPQYAALGNPLSENVSLDEALQAARTASRPGGNSGDALLSPFGSFAR
jgi:hypothetical protein